MQRLIAIGSVANAVLRQSISTPVISTILVVSVALGWGRISDWCIWVQVAIAITSIIVIVVLAIREGHRSQFKDKKMLEAIDKAMEKAMEKTRVDLNESLLTVANQLQNQQNREIAKIRKDIQRGFSEARELQEQDLEASDPSYKRDSLRTVLVSVTSADAQMGANAELGDLPPSPPPPTTSERLWRQIVYALKWIWGTHEA